MNENLILKKEARDFFDLNIKNLRDRYKINDIVVLLKEKLDLIKDPNDQSCFLKELENVINEFLIDHRNARHGGEPGESCVVEVISERFLFYLSRELNSLLVSEAEDRRSENENENEKVGASKGDTSNKIQRTKVFVCYSNEEEEYLENLNQHLEGFDEIKDDFWNATKLDPGAIWVDAIMKAINEAKVAVLYVSPGFYRSSFIKTQELPKLLAAAESEGVLILSVILKPCLFRRFSEINKYQAMNDPKKPVSGMNEHEKEELFVALAREIMNFMGK